MPYLIPATITVMIQIPALDRLVDYLTSDSGEIQSQIDAATAAIQTNSAELQASIQE